MNKQLNQIKELMRASETAQARQLLKAYLKDNPQDAEGWFLASFLHPTPQMRFEAIQRAAKLDPKQPTIQKRLAKLRASKGRSYRLPIILIIILLAGSIVLVLGLMGGAAPASSKVSELPTLAVLPTLTNLPPQPIATRENQAGEVLPTATVPPVIQPQTAATESLTPNVEATGISSAPQATANPVLPTQVFIQPGNPLPLPTADNNSTQITVIAPTSVSNSPTMTSTLQPSLTPVAPTPVSPTLVLQVVPLDKAINIAAGQFRVVAATRGAESMIQDLGGTFPPAPPNQSWVLLELLLICQDKATCAFDPSGLKIMSASGTMYPYSNQLNLTPPFGTITQNNQIWGYLGFIIPTSETQLKLILTESSQTYAITLE